MKPIHFVFLFLLAIAGITLFILLSDVPQNASGMSHESLTGVSVGGDGVARLETIGRAPFYFQICVIFLATSLLYMGVPERRRDGRFRLLFLAAAGYALFVWFNLYTSYEAYHETGTVQVLFGFPVPTNWFLWGVWSGFVVFDLLYVFAFRRYFLHPEDEQAFQDLLTEIKAEKGDA